MTAAQRQGRKAIMVDRELGRYFVGV